MLQVLIKLGVDLAAYVAYAVAPCGAPVAAPPDKSDYVFVCDR